MQLTPPHRARRSTKESATDSSVQSVTDALRHLSRSSSVLPFSPGAPASVVPIAGLLRRSAVKSRGACLSLSSYVGAGRSRKADGVDRPLQGARGGLNFHWGRGAAVDAPQPGRSLGPDDSLSHGRLFGLLSSGARRQTAAG